MSAFGEIRGEVGRSPIPLRLLVADDDALLRSIAAKRLGPGSAEIRTAANGAEALHFLEEPGINMVLLDLDMPKINGFEVLTRMRASPSTKHIPVIVITGRDDGVAIERAFAAGASSFVVKPINWDLLVHQIGFVRRAADNESSLIDNIVDLQRTRDELERASAELRKALAAADQASRAKTRFLASISHELRTPLNAIIGFSQLLLRMPDFQGQSRSRNYLQDVCDSGTHLLNLINSILDIANLDMGALQLCKAPIDLTDIIAQLAVEAVLPPKRNVTIRTDVAADIRPVDGDGRRIKQAMNYLLENAIKFSADGGQVSILACNQADEILIRIVDNGIGMDTANLPRVFEPFMQLDDRLERRYNGMGIGLAIAQKLIKLHGGDLAVASQPGQGTCISIRLQAI
jgi:signal transduction histidine kinase